MPAGSLLVQVLTIEVMEDKGEFKILPHMNKRDGNFSHLVRFRSFHQQFRIPELRALAELNNTQIDYDGVQVFVFHIEIHLFVRLKECVLEMPMKQ